MTDREKQWGEAFEGNREELCFILESPEKFKKNHDAQLSPHTD